MGLGNTRPPVVHPRRDAHDPAIDFNDGQQQQEEQERGWATVQEQEERARAFARAHEYLFLQGGGGVPYPKGFMPSPTFWRPYQLQRVQRPDGVQVVFNRESRDG